jgi:hypothetical protein
MTVFGGELATEGVGMGTIKNGFLVVCTKCGWHSTVEYRDGKLICNREQCLNEAKLDDGIQGDNASDNSSDIMSEDIGEGC